MGRVIRLTLWWFCSTTLYGSLASPAEATHATRSDMTEATAAMKQPHANVLAAQALGSSSGRYVRRKVSSFSGTREPSHIA